MIISCASTITNVEVHARGAVVTRRVELPKEGLPPAACELLVSGLTPQAEPTSLRAEVAGGRALVGLRSRVALPTAPPQPEGLEAKREALDEQIARARRDRERFQARLRSLDAIAPARRPRRLADPAVRAREMLAAAGLIHELEDSLDAGLTERDAELARLYEERDRLSVALARRDPARGPGADSATREVVVRLEPGDASVDGVTIHYVVAAARWWPAYTARLAKDGGEAELGLDAFVVQASGEAWDGVHLALSTAELVADARLPELASLRFGRRQLPVRTGFRPPPEGLDDLFAAYDACSNAAPPPPPPPPPPTPAPPPSVKPVALKALSSLRDEGACDEDDELLDAAQAELCSSESDAFVEPASEIRRKRAAPRKERAKRSKASMAPGMPPAPAPRSKPLAVRGAGRGGRSHAGDRSPLEPTDAWLDFDSLVLGETRDRRRRGRLIRGPGPDVAAYRAQGRQAVERAKTPRFARDPHDTRGRFDHRFLAEGLADVPSGDAPLRVGLSAAKAPCKQRLLAVPVEDGAVYREAELTNPFDAPLLGGPVDVFVGASLLTTTCLEKVGRGGAVKFGLGVEERVRIARNARVDESTTGFLSGTTEVVHRVSLQIRSSLPTATELVLIDRVPVSADDEVEVEVELVESTPPAERYRQTDRDSVVQGGLRWTLELPAGGEQKLGFVYRISLPSKREVVGGNHRD